MDRIMVGTLDDSSILIFVKKEDQDALNFYINEKSHETFVYLLEKDGVRRGCDFGRTKFRFSYLEPLPKVYERLRDYVNMCDPDRNMKVDHIQLYRYDEKSNEYKIPYNSKSIQLSDLVDADQYLTFEELAYPLKDLQNKEVVRVQNFLTDGSRGEQYVELVDKEIKMWDLAKDMKEKYLDNINGKEV